MGRLFSPTPWHRCSRAGWGEKSNFEDGTHPLVPFSWKEGPWPQLVKGTQGRIHPRTRPPKSFDYLSDLSHRAASVLLLILWLCQQLSLRTTLEWNKIQPLSRRLVQEPMMCTEARPTISSQHFSSSCKLPSLGDFFMSEVEFHVPKSIRR